MRLVSAVWRLLPQQDWSLTRRAVRWLTAQTERSADDAAAADFGLHVGAAAAAAAAAGGAAALAA